MTASTLTAEKMMAVIRETVRQIRDISDPEFCLPIIENKYLVDPVKPHSKRRGSRAYHRRIQKKWNRRFGMKPSTAIYNTSEGIVCHPVTADRLRRELADAGRANNPSIT